jgi:hypothetical protein
MVTPGATLRDGAWLTLPLYHCFWLDSTGHRLLNTTFNIMVGAACCKLQAVPPAANLCCNAPVLLHAGCLLRIWLQPYNTTAPAPLQCVLA